VEEANRIERISNSSNTKCRLDWLDRIWLMVIIHISGLRTHLLHPFEISEIFVKDGPC
jgi:hypothetical protein